MDALSQKPVKGSRLSGRVGLSLTESGQDGESDRDRAGNVVESSSRVLPTGSDQVEREKIVVVVAAVGHRLWLLIAVPERDGQVQGVRNGGRARRGVKTVSQQQSGQRVLVFFAGRKKRSGRLYLTLRRRY